MIERFCLQQNNRRITCRLQRGFLGLRRLVSPKQRVRVFAVELPRFPPFDMNTGVASGEKIEMPSRTDFFLDPFDHDERLLQVATFQCR
jgi:hypothetical protein